MDPLKEAFTKIKQDIFSLYSELQSIKKDLSEINRTLQILKNQTQLSENQAGRQINPTDHPPLEALESQLSSISTGNEGVPTDRQTNRQTNRQIPKFAQVDESETPNKEGRIDKLERVSEILDSLDDIKKDLRSKIKKLTPKEMMIFSTIYQLSEQGEKPDYSIIAKKLSLSESSIRDYVLKISNKGLPILKEKLQNKKVFLSIPSDFTRLASLKTLIQLREL